MSVSNIKYQNNYSNNNTKVSQIKSNNISFKESNYNTNNYPIKSTRTQNIKNPITTHIKIDLSKYNNNSRKEINNMNKNENIQKTRTIISNRDNIYQKNKISNNESKSRYINRSTRAINQKDTKIKYKKVYINLNKGNNANQDFNSNNSQYSTNNTYIAKNNKNNLILNTQNLTNNNISTISNNYSNKANNNIIFNNRKINYVKNQNSDNTNIKIKERENYYTNNNTNNELNRIENIYLNIHNNNVIKNNNNILIKQNGIHDIIKENNKNKNINNNIINPKDKKEEEEENIIDDEEDYVQENFNYDKNENKIKEKIYANINQDYLKKYFNDSPKIKEKNNLVQNTELNNNYMDYIQNEEQKLNIDKNLKNINTNLNLHIQEKKEKQKNDDINKRNINISLDSGTSSSINNTIKFQGMYNNFYGKTNNKDIIRDSTNIKNEKVFKNLIPKNSFQKFLTSKIKYYMSEESIPKKFISEFIHPKNSSKRMIHKKIISALQKSHQEDIKLDFSTYNEYYENENIISEIKRSKSKKYKKPKTVMVDENKELMNKINELKEYIDNSKLEMEQRDKKLKTYFQSFDRINTENENNKKRIENLEYELESKNNEVEEKRNEILELNNINNNLEIEMKRLKEEYINETINNREAKENYLIIKNNYNDMKNQFDLLNIKYKTLSDENYNFKRDKMLYLKELKSKNTIIDDLIEDNSNKKELKGKLNRLELNKIEEKEIKNYLSSNKKERKEKREESIKKQKNLKEIKQKETFFEKLNINELMNLRDELIGERTFITNEFYKIPVKANNKQNERRSELEQRIAEINNKLAKIRIRINILKEAKNNNYI